MYDTVEYQKEVNRLMEVRFSREQAEAIMQHVEKRQLANLGDLATKKDLADVRTELKRDIADVRTELKRDIADVRSELKSDIEKLEYKMDYKLRLLTVLVIVSPFIPEIFNRLLGLFVNN